MNNTLQEEINEALARAEDLQQRAENFIDVAGGINDSARIRLEEERGIDIDSNRWVPLDDIPHGEEVIRVKEELPTIEGAISTLENMLDGNVPAADIETTLADVIQGLNAAEGTLEECREDDVMRDNNNDDDDYYGYETEENEEEDDDEDE